MTKRMRNMAILILVMMITGNNYAQGWRQGEMEVTVTLTSPADVAALRETGLDFEPMAADGSRVRLYLVPVELERLRQRHIRYQVTISDLNRHFEHYWDNPAVPSGYYSYEEIIVIMDSLATHFPAICKKVVWGASLGNRELSALKISDYVNDDENEPEIMFDGGIHGDEVGGSQNVIMFARDLCLAYGSDTTITSMIDSREIWLYPMVNPDGRVYMSRYNNNGVDCNRDNGYMWNAEGNSTGAFSQIETKTLRNIILDNQFVVYTNYHSGTEILSYPWSYRSSAPRDLAHINSLASIYSDSSGYANFAFGQGYNVMYAINGSTKDFQYGSLGNVGWSIEISMNKQPPASQIPFYYNVNKPAMIALIKACGNGIEGTVTDSITGLPVRASVWVDNLYPVYTDPVVGDYHKYLIPGTYSLKVMANGYKTKTISNVTVPATGSVVTGFQLVPENNYYAYRVMSCRIPGNNFGDEGYTPGCLGKPDSVPYSLGRTGWIILDMGDTIFNGNGPDLKVIQAGTVNKNYTVSGSNSKDGPFTIIGSGSGTGSFDLGAAQIQKVRYIQIKDNGSGPASGAGAGFNLDAVEILTVPVIADFTTSNPSLCAHTMTNFQDASTGNPDSWTWSFPGGNPSFSTAQNPGNILYDQPGSYDVILTVTNGITSSTKVSTGFITVLPLPVVTLGSDTLLCEWEQLILDAGNPGCSYLWSTGDTTRTIVADTTGAGIGTMEFYVAVTDTQGCSGRDTIRITFTDCTAIPQHDRDGAVRIVPNPVCGLMTVYASGFEGGEWMLTGLDGVIARKGPVRAVNERLPVDVTGLRPGVYTLIITAPGSVETRKVIILEPR